MSLTFIGQQLIIYGGSTCLIRGLLGNSLNILIFLKENNSRTNPCAFYFVVASIVNIIYISMNFTSRIVGAIYGIDFSNISVYWCKIRQFLIVALSLITLTCSCLSAIDQYLITSRNIARRRFSKIIWAHRIIIFIIIIWFIHAIPCLLFYNISSITGKCVIINVRYAIYNRIYLLALLCAVPISILSVFGYLTYWNIRHTIVLANQNADRQLTRMALFQVVFVVLCLIPYSLNTFDPM